MAPAITHFLFGAAVSLLLVVPLALRYDIDREVALWLIPIGGVWGLFPDVHHITPVFEAELYALHNSPWVDLFAFHYTLDRPAVRARYDESVFGSIALFILSIATFWGSTHSSATGNRWLRRRPVISLVAMAGGAAYATVALGVLVSIQDAFPAVATLVGADSVLVGGLLVVPLGAGLGVLYAVGLETLSILEFDPDLPTAVGAGCAFGVASWLGGVVVALPLWLRLVTDATLSVPFVHAGSLVALVGYGLVFGVTYALLSGAFHSRAASS